MIIIAKNLSKTYAGAVPVRALHDVSLQVAEKEFIAIMGRSGSGKSTLLHLLGLLDQPSHGELTIDNVAVRTLSEKEKTQYRLTKLGYVFQEYALLPELTAIESISLPLLANGLNKKAAYERGREVLKQVGLEHRLRHRTNALSGGEQQRVAIARAIANKPAILFADEPCANLDTASSKTILSLLRELNKVSGQTIVMVTHEPEDKQYVDRTIWLKDGLISSEHSN